MNNTQSRRVDDSHNPEPDLIPTSPMIDGVEKIDDWLEHREIVVQELCPLGALETMYAQRAALYLWRLKRVIGFANDASLGGIEARSEKSLDDSQESRVYRDSPDQPTLQTIIKYEAHLVRCLSSTMAELRRLQKERRQGLRDANPRRRGADRAGVCQNQQIKAGSPGGSPSQISSPSQKSSPTRSSGGAEMSIPGGRGADRAGDCQHQQIKDGSPGGSPSQICSPSQKSSPMQSGSPMHTGSRNQRISSSRHHVASKRASPVPKPPPLLESITNRRRLEEYTLGQTFERTLASATLDFAMIPRP